METAKMIDSIANLSWLGLFLIFSILLLSFFPEAPKPEPELIDVMEYEGRTELPDSVQMVYNRGKGLFKNNCASCHNKNMRDDLTGPALSGTLERWKDYPQGDLYQWIRNSQYLIQEKHPRALLLWKDWNQIAMNSFPNLSDEDIEALLVYIEEK